jgi:hypothetical protein
VSNSTSVIVRWCSGLNTMIDKVRRWQPEREIMLVGDGSYAAIVLVQRCQRLKKPVKLVSRLRLDARLFDFPKPQPKSKRGPKPKKGKRQTKLSERLEDPETKWQELELVLYGQQHLVEFISGVSRSGIPQEKTRSLCAGCWSVVPRTASHLLLSSVRIPRYRPSKSSCGPPGAGISKSPSKNCAPFSVSKPNASGQTGLSNAPRLVSSVSSAW